MRGFLLGGFLSPLRLNVIGESLYRRNENFATLVDRTMSRTLMGRKDCENTRTSYW